MGSLKYITVNFKSNRQTLTLHISVSININFFRAFLKFTVTAIYNTAVIFFTLSLYRSNYKVKVNAVYKKYYQ